MPFQVIWQRDALDQLFDLVDQVARHDILAATRLYEDLWHAPDPLTRVPMAVHKNSPRVDGQHEIVVRPNYVVLYELNAARMQATVTAVYHARQQR